MQRWLWLTCVVGLLCTGTVFGQEKKTRILLVGKDRDHPFGGHEYMADCTILAKCLGQTAGVEAIVSNGWPKDQAKLKDISAMVLHTRMGGNVLFDPLVRNQVEGMLQNGVGVTAIHWSTGADKKLGNLWLQTLGGWFNTDFSRYLVRTTKLQQCDTSHPICRGWKEYDLRDEYYIQLKFAETAKPILKVEIDKKEYTVAWAYDRPKTKQGRSFGFVCGHFHANFGEKNFRQAIVNGVLWTAHLDVPPDGAPCNIIPKDMELPPDTRKKK